MTDAPPPGRDHPAHAVLRAKRDTRRYLPDQVDDVVLNRILGAGRMAGSAKNQQSVRIVVVRDTATKRALRACGDFADWIDQPPLVLVLCVSEEAGPRRLFDVGRMAQNLMLAATVEGLASCPVTMHRDECCREVLGVPEDHEVPMVVTLGHPAPSDRSRRSHPRLPLEELVFWGRWQGPKPPAVLCHLVVASDWEHAVGTGVHAPPSLAAEGFVHFSTIDQTVATAERYYPDAEDLLILGVRAADVAADLRLEQPTDPDSPVADQYFPHLYRALDPTEVAVVAPFERSGETFAIPSAIAELTQTASLD